MRQAIAEEAASRQPKGRTEFLQRLQLIQNYRQKQETPKEGV
jgi:hypothetical protein